MYLTRDKLVSSSLVTAFTLQCITCVCCSSSGAELEKKQASAYERIISEQTIKEWKNQIIAALTERIQETGFSNSKTRMGMPAMRVKFTLHKDRTFSKIHSETLDSHSNYGAASYSILPNRIIRSFEGSAIVSFPKELVSDHMDFDFNIPHERAPVSTTQVQNHITTPITQNSKCDIKTAWSYWHRNFVTVLVSRIFEKARREIPSAQPATCKMVYRISRHGEIDRIEIESDNPLLGEISYSELRDMKNSSALSFPKEDSDTEFVPKRTEFIFPRTQSSLSIGDFEE